MTDIERKVTGGDTAEGTVDMIDVWGGHPPENERLRLAFVTFSSDPRKLAIIRDFISLGRQIHDEALGDARPTPKAFEDLIDVLEQKPQNRFLFEDHPIFASTTLGVLRWAAGPKVAGSREIPYRSSGRSVSDKSGKR
jgi:hypothetical protein